MVDSGALTVAPSLQGFPKIAIESGFLGAFEQSKGDVEHG